MRLRGGKMTKLERKILRYVRKNKGMICECHACRMDFGIRKIRELDREFAEGLAKVFRRKK